MLLELTKSDAVAVGHKVDGLLDSIAVSKTLSIADDWVHVGDVEPHTKVVGAEAVEVDQSVLWSKSVCDHEPSINKAVAAWVDILELEGTDGCTVDGVGWLWDVGWSHGVVAEELPLLVVGADLLHHLVPGVLGNIPDVGVVSHLDWDHDWEGTECEVLVLHAPLLVDTSEVDWSPEEEVGWELSLDAVLLLKGHVTKGGGSP